MRLLLTGATGFVGNAVLQAAEARGHQVIPVIRNSSPDTLASALRYVISGVEHQLHWQKILNGVDAVVHAAAVVHQVDGRNLIQLSDYYRVNVEGTMRLARQAAASGVRRFVFLSTVKVNGEFTTPGKPFTAEGFPNPLCAYGLSKQEAEKRLLELAQETAMEIVIIRPPLVYGPGVKANFLAMMQWLNRALPLPLGGIDNRRSLVALDNLTDLILTCLSHPAAANQVFLVSDDQDLSTPELLRRLCRALGRPDRLLPIPEYWLRLGARLLGCSTMARRLCDSLQVDIGKTKLMLGWVPPVTVDEALLMTAKDFLDSK